MSTDNANVEHPANDLGRMIGGRFSTAVVLFHAAVADRLGVNVTDWKCAEILFRNGPMNPGKLSEITGMTTAATTQVINRLEKSGVIKRERDPLDRRKVLVHPVDNPHIRQVTAMIFAELGVEMGQMMGRYSPDELNVIGDFVAHTSEILECLATKLRRDVPGN